MPKTIDEQALFDATVQRYGARGYAAATTKEIADDAGVNEATIFRRYGSKADLIVTALRACLQASAFGRIRATGDLRADATAIARAYRDTFAAYGGAVLTLLSEVPRHPELAGAAGVMATNLGAARAILADHQAAGRLRPGDPMGHLAALIGPIAMAGYWARAVGGSDALGPDLDQHVRAFLEGHAA